MLKNPKYLYGPRNLEVPADINFGNYCLDKMWNYENKIAIIDGSTGAELTYAEIAQQAMNFALSLTRMGVGKGEVIGLFSESRLESWGAVLGVACAGAVLTTFSTAYIKDELIHVVNISKPSYIVCSATIYKKHINMLKTLVFLKKIILFGDEKHPEVIMFNDMTFEKNKMIKNVTYDDFQSVEVQGQSDTLFILYSSGTTGLPKGVMLTHLNVISNCFLPLAYDPKDTGLLVTPWYHVIGLVGILTGFAHGSSAVFLAKFDLDLYLRTVMKYKISRLVVVPPLLVAICKHPCNYDLSSVKLINSGAAPLRRNTMEAVEKIFPNVRYIYQGYGATELTLGVARHTHGTALPKPGSVGNVVSNTIIKIVDIDTRIPLGPNKTGEVCVKGVLLMKGYVGRDMSSEIDEEGFYKTGDVGYYDEDGSLFIVDRLKELIKYKGYQVPPAEVEAALLQNPSIKDAAVIGIDDEMAGEVPLAFVVPQPGKELTEKEVKDFIAERLSNPKHLRGGVRFINQIPKSANGKILRRELKKLLITPKSHL